jgi:DNA-binding protein HU-beta
MNKQELIKELSEKSKITLTLAENLLDSVTEIIVEAVRKGDEVKIKNFGTFVKFKRKARAYFDPSARSMIQKSARWFPKFKASETFVERVRE